MTKNLHRFITTYEKAGDALVETISLSADEFETIRKFLLCERTDPMVYVYPLQGEVLRQVFEVLEGKLNRGDYDYFLETGSD